MRPDSWTYPCLIFWIIVALYLLEINIVVKIWTSAILVLHNLIFMVQAKEIIMFNFFFGVIFLFCSAFFTEMRIF